MPFIAVHPETWLGKFAPPNNECVSLVKAAAGAPQTALWRKGAPVRGNLTLARGTAIATFNDVGRYASNPRGNHAAIYIRQDGTSIWVYDQWAERPERNRKAKPVSERQISFKGGRGSVCDDGDAYSVIQ
jgi:hypothetical protein